MFRRTRKNPTATIKDFTEGPVIPEAAADYFDAANVTFDPDGYLTVGGNRTGNPLSFLPSGVFNSLAGKPALGASGVVGNGVTDDRASLASSDTASATASLPLMLSSGTYKVSSNLTISSPMWFLPGAKLKPDNGVTITITGGIVQASLSQIFDLSAGGTVILRNVEFYHPAWWGPVGTSDDSQTWQAMAASIVASTSGSSGQRVMCPPGQNRIIGVTLSNCEVFAGRGVSEILPPVSATSGTVLTLGDYAQLNGGRFSTDQPGHAVLLVWLKGLRSAWHFGQTGPKAAGSTGLRLGELGTDTITPIISNLFINTAMETPPAGSLGIDVQSPDMEASNIVVAQCDTGIKGSWTAGARWTNLHVWGNNTGIAGGNWDNSQFTNVYLDNNRGWGMDVTAMDRCYWNGLYVWENGGGISSTGGVRVARPSGSAQYTTMRGVVLDDNVGHGMYISGVTDYDIEVVLSSTAMQAGNPVVTTTGVEITSTSTRTVLRYRGAAATAVTPIVDNSTSTMYGSWSADAHLAASKAAPVDADEFPLVDSAASFRSKKVTFGDLKTALATSARTVSTSDTVVNNTTTYSSIATVQTKPLTKYVIRGAVVVTSVAANAKFQIRNNHSDTTGPSGYFADASSNVDITDAAAAAGTGITITVTPGVRKVVHFFGYVTTGLGLSTQNLSLRVGQFSATASDTTFHAGSWIEVQQV